jgi:hypothetical protein
MTLQQRIELLSQVTLPNITDEKPSIFSLLSKVHAHDFREKINFDLSHPEWVREIEDTL